MQHGLDTLKVFGQRRGVADVTLDDRQVRMIEGQEFLAVIEDVINGYMIAHIK